MKISELNVTNSIRNIYNETSRRFLIIGQMITQIWNRIIKGNQPPKETFQSYIKDHNFTLVTLSPEGTATLDWDINNKEFPSSQLRNSIENIESIFKKNNEALYLYYIKPILDRSNIRENVISLQEDFFQEELKRVDIELNNADQEAQNEIMTDKIKYDQELLKLQIDKAKEMNKESIILNQELQISCKRFSEFQTGMKTLLDIFMENIAKDMKSSNSQSNKKELSNIIENFVEENKKSTSLIEKKVSKSVNQCFNPRSLDLFEKIELKYNDKKESVDKTHEENLNLLNQNALKAKHKIKENSDQKINSIPYKIEKIFTDLITALSSQIQEELDRATKEENKANDAEQKQVISEMRNSRHDLNNLEQEKQKEIEHKFNILTEAFESSRKEIYDDKLEIIKKADLYLDDVAKLNKEYKMESKELSNILINLAEERKNLACSTAKKSLKDLRKEFSTISSETYKEIDLKYREKENVREKTRDDKLLSIHQKTREEKQRIQKTLDEKIKAIPFEFTIEDLRQKLITTNLSSVGSKNEEVVTSSEIAQKHESNEQDESLSANSLQENILQENQVTTDSLEDSTEQSNPVSEVVVNFSLNEDQVDTGDQVQGKKEDTLEEERQSQDSLITTIYNGLMGTLSRTFQNFYPDNL